MLLYHPKSPGGRFLTGENKFMFEQEEHEPTGSYWPSVTDLFMTLFIIAIVVLGAVSFVLLPKNNVPAPEPVQFAVGKDFNKVVRPVNRLRVELGLEPVKYGGASQVIRDLDITVDSAIKILDQLKKLELENRILKKESPTFVIDERRQEFRFDSGSPVIKKNFARALRRNLGDSAAPFPDFAAKIVESPDRFNTLEIIGHTDGVPLSRSSNLDQRLPYLLAGQLSGSSKLTPGSNNDLGLLRALALKQEWLEYVDTFYPAEHRKLLRKIEIRCYSAGQTILPIRVNSPKPSDFTKNDPRARRIEMRLTRLGVFAVDSDTNRTD